MKGEQPMVQETEILIVGAGPAGMAAAIEASKMGAEVLVIDESPQPGGQIFAQPPPTLAFRALKKEQQKGRKTNRCPEGPGCPATRQHPGLGFASGENHCHLSRGEQ